MAKRSKIATLPPAVKGWLDTALVEGNFSGYELLEAELRTRGFAIGKSSIHRYGSAFEQKLSMLKLDSEQAGAIVTAAPDDEGAVNEALMRLVGPCRSLVDVGAGCGMLGAILAEGGFWDLDAPVERVCTAEVPIPYARHLELAALPKVAEIVAAVRTVLHA